MKKLTCRELGGACDVEITGNSFVEIGKKCREHVMEQIKNGDAAHSAAAAKMQNASPEEQRSMMAEFEKRYNAYPNGTCGSHLAQSELRGANYTLGAALYLFSNSAIIDRCSSGEAFCIFAAAALWAASPFLICSM